MWLNNAFHQPKKQLIRLTIREIALMGMMVALIEVSKMALSFLPNIELTTFWLIMFTLFWGWRIVFIVPVFLLVEVSMYGLQLWVIMYLYIWPLLVFLTYLLRRQTSIWFWSFFSAFFGLFFGLLCAVPYAVIGAAGGGLAGGLSAGFAWWVAGIPWDFVHGAGNFTLMLMLYRPIRTLMLRLKRAAFL